MEIEKLSGSYHQQDHRYKTDARTTSFQLTDDGGYRVPTNTRPTRIWRDLNEMNVVSVLDITNKLSLFDNDALLGLVYLVLISKERTYTVHRLRLILGSQEMLMNYFFRKIFVPY